MSATRKDRKDDAYRCVKAMALAVSLAFSALLMAVAATSSDAWWVAWIGLLPLFWAIRALSPVGAALSGAVWGGSLYVAFSVSGAASHISPGPLSLALLITMPAIYAGLGSLLTRARGFRPITLALGWIAVEVALEPIGLRGGLLAGTQTGGAGFDWVTRVLGYAFVAFVVVCASASLLAVLSSSARLRVAADESLAELFDSGRRSTSQISYCIQLLSLCQVYPRAPPPASAAASVV